MCIYLTTLGLHHPAYQRDADAKKATRSTSELGERLRVLEAELAQTKAAAAAAAAAAAREVRRKSVEAAFGGVGEKDAGVADSGEQLRTHRERKRSCWCHLRGQASACGCTGSTGTRDSQYTGVNSTSPPGDVRVSGRANTRCWVL
jgi:hypothetical protein